MEETKQQLQQTISGHHLINADCSLPHAKLFAIHTILYAIVAMRLQFFKNDDIRELFAPLKDINNEKLNFIFTLLEKYKDLDVDSAKKCVVESADKCLAKSKTEYIECTVCNDYNTKFVNYVADEQSKNEDEQSAHCLTCANNIASLNECAAESAAKCVAKDDKSTDSIDDAHADLIDIAYAQYDQYTDANFAYLSYYAVEAANHTKSTKLALLNLIFAYTYILK
jgi:hypothetical protein